MSYSHELLRNRGGNFWVTWLLGNCGSSASKSKKKTTTTGSGDASGTCRGVKKSDILGTRVEVVCDEISGMLLRREEDLTLRVAAVLVAGTVRCHRGQVEALLGETRLLMRSMRIHFAGMKKEEDEARLLDLTEIDRVSTDYDFDLGEETFDLGKDLAGLGRFSVAPKQITMVEDFEDLLRLPEDNGFGSEGDDRRQLPTMFDSDGENLSAIGNDDAASPDLLGEVEMPLNETTNVRGRSHSSPRIPPNAPERGQGNGRRRREDQTFDSEDANGVQYARMVKRLMMPSSPLPDFNVTNHGSPKVSGAKPDTVVTQLPLGPLQQQLRRPRRRKSFVALDVGATTISAEQMQLNILQNNETADKLIDVEQLVHHRPQVPTDPLAANPSRNLLNEDLRRHFQSRARSASMSTADEEEGEADTYVEPSILKKVSKKKKPAAKKPSEACIRDLDETDVPRFLDFTLGSRKDIFTNVIADVLDGAAHCFADKGLQSGVTERFKDLWLSKLEAAKSAHQEKEKEMAVVASAVANSSSGVEIIRDGPGIARSSMMEESGRDESLFFGSLSDIDGGTGGAELIPDDITDPLLPPRASSNLCNEEEGKEMGSSSVSGVMDISEWLDRIEFLTDVGAKKTNFEEVVQELDRKRSVALAFRKLLDLQAKGRVDLSQEEYLGDIEIVLLQS